MKTIPVYLKDRSYDVIVSRGIFKSEAASRICEYVPAREKVAIVSDNNVWDLYGASLLEMLGQKGVSCFSAIIKPGEDSKDMQTLGQLLERFAEEGLGRGGLVVALGGGVVSDVAGFAAACWMRGVHYVLIPTSLLAMIASSVGGNTAIDIPAGKNLVGAYHQPSLVLVDPDLLETLPEKEFAGGMAEVIKYGAIQSKILFNNIEAMKYEASSPEIMDVITDCVRIKAKIVSGDELDKGRRALLNFGHPFGHAIESKYEYFHYPYSASVAEGMHIAAMYGEAAGITIPGTTDRIESILVEYGFNCKEPVDGLFQNIMRDKKVSGDTIPLVLLKEIGRAEIFDMPLSEIEEQLEEL